MLTVKNILLFSVLMGGLVGGLVALNLDQTYSRRFILLTPKPVGTLQVHEIKSTFDQWPKDHTLSKAFVDIYAGAKPDEVGVFVKSKHESFVRQSEWVVGFLDYVNKKYSFRLGKDEMLKIVFAEEMRLDDMGSTRLQSFVLYVLYSLSLSLVAIGIFLGRLGYEHRK